MRLESPLVVFILGMAASLIMFGILMLAGPRLAPNQLDQCWIELRKNIPNCSTKMMNNATYIRDVRCVKPAAGLMLVSEGTTGWYRLAQVPEPQEVKPQVPKE